MDDNDDNELRSLLCTIDGPATRWLVSKAGNQFETLHENISDLNMGHFALVNKIRAIVRKQQDDEVVVQKTSDCSIGSNVERTKSVSSEASLEWERFEINDPMDEPRGGADDSFLCKEATCNEGDEVNPSSLSIYDLISPEKSHTRESSRDRRLNDFKDVQNAALAQMENLQRSVLLMPPETSSSGSSYHSALSSTPPDDLQPSKRQPIKYGAKRKGTETLRTSPESKPGNRIPKPYADGRQRKTETLSISPTSQQNTLIPSVISRDRSRSCDMRKREGHKSPTTTQTATNNQVKQARAISRPPQLRLKSGNNQQQQPTIAKCVQRKPLQAQSTVTQSLIRPPSKSGLQHFIKFPTKSNLPRFSSKTIRKTSSQGRRVDL